MQGWERKANEQFANMREPGEQELHSGYGIIALKSTKFILTSKRLYIFHAGATGWSDPRAAVIELPNIIRVEVDPGVMVNSPTLILQTRMGNFTILLSKEARKEGGAWTNWILDAQARAAVA